MKAPTSVRAPARREIDLRIEHDREHVVGDHAAAWVLGLDRAAARQHAGQQLGDDAERITLASPERQQHAGRIGEQHVRIVGGMARAVDQRARRRLASFGGQHARLVHRDRTGGHVDDQWRAVVRQGPREAERVGGEARFGAAERRHHRHAVGDVGEGHEHQPFVSAHLAVMAHAPQVMAVAQCQDAHALVEGARLGLFHHHAAHVLAQAAIALEQQQVAMVGQHAGAAGRINLVVLQHLAVARQDRQAVARVADAIGFHQVAGGVLGDILGHPQREQQALAEVGGVVERNAHLGSSWWLVDEGPMRSRLRACRASASR